MIKKILMLVLFMAPLSLFAQKFAHFNSDEILKVYPAYTTAMTELETMGKKYETDLQEMQKELEAKVEKYRREVNDSTPENIVQRKQQELQELDARIRQAYEDNQKAFQQARQTKMQPILMKVTEAVNAVVKEGGYIYAIDRSNPSTDGLYLNESLSTDITKTIMQKLGISAAR
ncbi:MAG: OmpH family outer membrane protein [Bacteroidaceae bacterium]|nr:OmpH family outer membrane protein [Bacteroidaceae bacterium]